MLGAGGRERHWSAVIDLCHQSHPATSDLASLRGDGFGGH